MGLSWITAESIFLFPEANDWRFWRILSHPLTSCSLSIFFYYKEVWANSSRGAGGWEPLGIPSLSRQGLAARACSTAPACKQGSWGQPQPLALGISLGTRKSWGWVRTWAHRCTWLSGTHGQAGQSYGKLEASPAAVFLGQRLKALGGCHGVLGPG